MKPRRKLTAIVMAAAMMMTMVPTAFAAETSETDGLQATSIDSSLTYERPDGKEMSTKIFDMNALSTEQSNISTLSINTTGKGTENDPIQLSSPEDFTVQNWMSNSYYVLTNDIDFSNSTAFANVPEWGALINGFWGAY